MPSIKDATDISAIQLKESAAPANPAAGYGRLYLGTDEKLHIITDDPLDKIVGGGGLGVSQDAPTQLTIASGAITVTQGLHKIETQGGAGSDDLDTINGLEPDALYMFFAHDAAHTVVFKHGTGNIISPTISDIRLTDADTYVLGIADSAGANLHLLTPSRPNDVDTWGSYPDNSIMFAAADTTTGEMYGLTGDEMQLWRTYQLNSALSIDAVPNQHFVLDSATAFLTQINASTPQAGFAWTVQVLTAPGAGSHTIKLLSGTWDGTNNTISLNATTDLLRGKWISSTRFLIEDNVSVVLSTT